MEVHGPGAVVHNKGLLTLLQVVFPSTDVTTCSYSDASTPTCETKLLVQWIIYGGGSNLALSVQLDNGVNFTDQYGRPWGAAQPINIQLSLLNSRIEYGMTYKGMYRNAYEKRVPTQSAANQCPTNHNDVSYFPWLGYDASLAFNSTTWYGYALGFGVWKYDVQVALSQGTLYQGLFLNSVSPSASLSGISVTLHSPQVNQNKLTNYNYYTYMLPSTNVSLPGSGFLVPDGNIGILPNQIGVLTDQWLGAYQCNQALGLKTMVQTANPYDQFAAFRSSSLEAENPTSGCLLRSNASNANPFSTSPLLQTFACPDVGSMRVQMEISSASYKLQALYGVPLITGSGMYALSPTDAYATIYLDCSNSGTYDGVFTFQPVNCCVTRWPSTTCSGVTFQSASTVTVPPSGAARVTFIVDSHQVLGANGTCAFDVLQHARVEQRVTATFDTSLTDYLSGGVPITGEAPDCFDPYIIVQKGSTRYCVPPCTQDQEWDASMSVCRGVDCSLKYLGARNWYNLTAGLCQAAATCTSAQTYVSSNNSCVNKTATIEATNCTSVACSLDTTLFTPVTLTIDCGEHGTYANHSCNCTEGYTTVFGDRVTNSSGLGWCTTLVVASSSSSIASSLMVAVVALGLGLGLCCCGFAVSTGGLLYLQARARKRWARERLEHHHAAQAREQQLLTLQLTAMNQWPRAQQPPPTPADLNGPPLPGSQRFGDHRDDSDENGNEADHHQNNDDDDHHQNNDDDDEEAQQAAGDDGWHNYYNTGFEGGGGRARSAAGATTRYTVRVVSGTLPVWQQRLQQQQQLKEKEKEEKEEKEKKEASSAEAPQERGWRRGRRRRGVNEMATLLGEHLNFLWANLAGFTRSPSSTAAPTPDHHGHDHDGEGDDRADGDGDEGDRPLPAIPTTTTDRNGDDDEEEPVEVVETEMVEEGEEVEEVAVMSPAELLRTLKARQPREGDEEEEVEHGDGRGKRRKSGIKKTKTTAKKKRGESSAPPNGLLALVSGYE